MSYPVTITKNEFETATGMMIDAYVRGDEGEVNIKTQKFLNDIAYYTFECAIYPAGQRYYVDKIITAFPDVADQIKEVMYKVGEYILNNLSQGYNFGQYAGMEVLESGSVEVKDTQEVISKILPPNIMSYVMNIYPSLIYAGGANV